LIATGTKGRYWQTMYVAATMGPSIQVDINALRDMKLRCLIVDFRFSNLKSKIEINKAGDGRSQLA